MGGGGGAFERESDWSARYGRRSVSGNTRWGAVHNNVWRKWI